MSKVQEIASGLKNVVKKTLDLTSEEENNLFDARKKICDACPENTGVICNICKCVLSVKTKSLRTSCPKKYW